MMKKSNIICFIISLILLRFGISGVKFGLENGIFVVRDSVVAGMELFVSMFSYVWLIISIILLVNGITLTIITINFGKSSIKAAKDTGNKTITDNAKAGIIVEIIMYVIWIIGALL